MWVVCNFTSYLVWLILVVGVGFRWMFNLLRRFHGGFCGTLCLGVFDFGF